MVSFVALATACSTSDEPSQQASLEITSGGVMTFPVEGGSGEINYTLKNVSSNAKLTVQCTSEWVKNISVGNVITFNVEANDTTEERSALVLISYKNASAQVIIEQQGMPDVEFVASYLNGKFYGKDNNPNAYQYSVVLSKYGSTGRTNHYAGDNYYHFNIYSSVPSAADPYLAWGEYIFDATNSCAAGTFSEDMSEYVTVDDAGNETYLKITAGKIVVVEGGIDALLTLEDGSVHHVIYNGSLHLGYLSEISKGPYSSIEGDYTFNIEGGAMMLLYDGDDYGLGRGSWEVRFMTRADLMSGDFFRFNVVVESLDYDQELIFRTFTADTASTYAAGTFEPGYKYNGDLYGSWYMPVNEGYFGYVAAAFAGGSITVEHLGDDEAIVTVDAVDDLGHKVQGTCHCQYIQVYDRTSM